MESERRLATALESVSAGWLLGWTSLGLALQSGSVLVEEWAKDFCLHGRTATARVEGTY